MAKAGQLSPSPLAGISQSEGAALETWNRLNKMKWTKQRKINLKNKKKIHGDVGEKENGRWRNEENSAENYKETYC